MHLDGVLVEADAAFADMFGFADADEAIGTLLFDLVGSDARAGASSWSACAKTAG